LIRRALNGSDGVIRALVASSTASRSSWWGRPRRRIGLSSEPRGSWRGRAECADCKRKSRSTPRATSFTA